MEQIMDQIISMPQLDSGDYLYLREHVLKKASCRIINAIQSTSPEFFIEHFAEIASFLDKALLIAKHEKKLIEERLRREQEEAAFKEWLKNSEPKKPAV